MDAPPEINVAEYIKNPNFCPWCKSDDITTLGPMGHKDSITWIDIRCMDCNAEWMDEFQIHHISWDKNGNRIHSNEHFQD